MDVRNLKYNMGLFTKRKELEEQLQFLEREIVSQQGKCNHVGVVLGHVGTFAYRDTAVSQCLFCSKKIELYPFQIDATTYLRDRYHEGATKEERRGKLLALQSLWVTLAEEYPDATMEELVELMKEQIQIDEEKNKNMEKTLGFPL